MESRLLRWDNSYLSFGGRIVLTNSVLTNIPIYALTFSRIPPSISKAILKIQRWFLWGGGSRKEKRMAWVNWDIVCRDKSRGV
ncbi:hypothetical protein ACS0TY_006182 [Phlomoides rotata]